MGLDAVPALPVTTVKVPPAPAMVPAAALSEGELRILERLAVGEPNKQIARDLGITDTTVKVHLRMIFKKLGVSNRTQAAFFARERSAIVA